jgi:type VI secretion system protein ImpM
VPSADPPGFYGKVPSRGDFVGRRLPPDFIAVWDRWLQDGLRQSRELLGAAWLDLYLNSPVWRFALDAGVCGGEAMAGVMIPSVDRVGRYFPFTVAGAVAPAVIGADLFEREAAWFDVLEQCALDSLAEGFSLQRMDAALCALGAPRAAADGGAAPASGRALFLGGGSPLLPPALLDCAGLPPPGIFCAMLGGAALSAPEPPVR